MLDLLVQLELVAIGEIIKRTIAAGAEWAKRRKKPAAAEVKQKVEELVAKAADAVVSAGTPTEERRRLVVDIAQLALPTFEQVVEYSPNTQRVIRAARKKGRGPAKRVAPKFLVKKAVAKRTVRKASKRR